MNPKINFTLSVALALIAPGISASSPAHPPVRSGFEAVVLVSNRPGIGATFDRSLVNAWGISHPPHGPLWVSDNGTNRTTLYNRRTGAKVGLTVKIVHGGAPTGQVFVPQEDDGDVDFPVQKKGVSGPSLFVFVTEAGTIEGWNPGVDPDHAVVAVDRSAQGSVFKGVALGHEKLFAADFTNNLVEVFDDQFRQIRTFTDPSLPNRFAPFNVARLNGLYYVAFAKREKGGIDDLHGAGLGYVDVFTGAGQLMKHLIANGPLNAPWGMTIAPKGFGSLSGALLVGNFGNGKINAFDPNTGQFLGELMRPGGRPLKIDGLWALEAGPENAVTFSAGPNDESDGLVGQIRPTNP